MHARRDAGCYVLLRTVHYGVVPASIWVHLRFTHALLLGRCRRGSSVRALRRRRKGRMRARTRCYAYYIDINYATTGFAIVRSHFRAWGRWGFCFHGDGSEAGINRYCAAMTVLRLA